VVIYQGISQSVGPFSLSEVYVDTQVLLDGLTTYQREQISRTIAFSSFAEAQALVDSLTSGK
jgi:protein phosphatase